MKYLLLVILGLLASAQARIAMADVRTAEWEIYKEEFNKNYEDESQDRLRQQVFEDNKEIIEAHNKRWAAGEETYEMGVNEYTDLLEEEFDNLFADQNGSLPDDDEDFAEEEEEEEEDYVTDHNDVDWRAMGAVTAVQHQGHFNNSWAFAAAGAVESRHFVAKGHLVTLSKQNLVDCCRSKHKRTLNAFKCIKKYRGIERESAYHYRGPAGKCLFNRHYVSATIKKYYQSRKGSESALAKNVAHGPVAAVISRDAIRFYKSGVFHNSRCSNKAEYVVLVVGYGHCPNSGDFWLLKTSLGPNWGEKGYLRLGRNSKNLCGIANRAYYPVI